MSEPKPKNAQDPSKKIAAALFLIAAVGLLIHRLPKRGYVEVHADKPRPIARAGDSASTAAAPAAARPLPKPEKFVPLARAPRGPAPAAEVQPSEFLKPPANWQDTCAGEIGILCYRVAAQRLPRCLSRYDSALRKTCRVALNRRSH